MAEFKLLKKSLRFIKADVKKRPEGNVSARFKLIEDELISPLSSLCVLFTDLIHYLTFNVWFSA